MNLALRTALVVGFFGAAIGCSSTGRGSDPDDDGTQQSAGAQGEIDAVDYTDLPVDSITDGVVRFSRAATFARRRSEKA